MSRTVRLASEVTGSVWQVNATVGQRVERDSVLLILESMKMEIPLEAPFAGTVRELLCAAGDQVDEGAVLVVFDGE